MTTLLLYVLLWLWDNRNFDSITKANERKLEAERAFRRNDYRQAADLYHQIAYGSIFSDPGVRLNMAHSYFKGGQYDLALRHYKLLQKVENKAISSIAYNQIALIQVIKKDTGAALGNLKTALKLETGNDLARANYIILKRLFSGKEIPSVTPASKSEAEQMVQNEKEAARPPAEKPNGQEVEENAKREQLLQSLKAMNMSEAQASAILDAMKSNESQYIYQLRRKQYARKPESNEPIEW